MSRVSSLRTHLEVYEPVSGEAHAVAAVLNLLATVDNPLSDENYIPGHVTASAFVVDRAQKRLLLIHHAKLDRWLQPGGHIDPGEDPMTAAIREVQEETGVDGVPLGSGIFDVDVHPIPAHGGRPPHIHYDVRFLLKATSDVLGDSDEVLGAKWVPFREVPSVVPEDSVRRATRKMERIFG